MPDKITSKNLSYDSSLPPFLAALKGQASGSHGPDPILSGRRRIAKKRSDSEEAEDAPIVLDEDGNAVAIQFDKDGTVKQPTEDASKTDDARETVVSTEDDKPSKDKDTKSNISFGSKKRKAVKVIGDDSEPKDASIAKDNDKDKDTSKDTDKKVKKKAKKIKLSFDEE